MIKKLHESGGGSVAFQKSSSSCVDPLLSTVPIMNCWVCDNNDRFEVLPEWERIAADEYWRVAHAIDTALPGWLVLIPRRHVTSIADLTDAEAADLGAWQVRLSRALGTVTGCMKTYVVVR